MIILMVESCVLKSATLLVAQSWKTLHRGRRTRDNCRSEIETSLISGITTRQSYFLYLPIFHPFTLSSRNLVLVPRLGRDVWQSSWVYPTACVLGPITEVLIQINTGSVLCFGVTAMNMPCQKQYPKQASRLNFLQRSWEYTWLPTMALLQELKEIASKKNWFNRLVVFTGGSAVDDKHSSSNIPIGIKLIIMNLDTIQIE